MDKTDLLDQLQAEMAAMRVEYDRNDDFALSVFSVVQALLLHMPLSPEQAQVVEEQLHNEYTQHLAAQKQDPLSERHFAGYSLYCQLALLGRLPGERAAQIAQERLAAVQARVVLDRVARKSP